MTLSTLHTFRDVVAPGQTINLDWRAHEPCVLQHLEWRGSHDDANALTVTSVGAITSLLTAAPGDMSMACFTLSEPARYDVSLLRGQGVWLVVRNDSDRAITLNLEVRGEH